MALFTRTAKLDPEAHGARCATAMAVHHAVGTSRQRNSGYRPSRINIMAQGHSTPNPSLRPTHLSIRRGRAQLHTTHTIRLAWWCHATLHYSHFPGVVHWASLWGRPQHWYAKGACATPKDKNKDKGIVEITRKYCEDQDQDVYLFFLSSRHHETMSEVLRTTHVYTTQCAMLLVWSK